MQNYKADTELLFIQYYAKYNIILLQERTKFFKNKMQNKILLQNPSKKKKKEQKKKKKQRK